MFNEFGSRGIEGLRINECRNLSKKASKPEPTIDINFIQSTSLAALCEMNNDDDRRRLTPEEKAFLRGQATGI